MTVSDLQYEDNNSNYDHHHSFKLLSNYTTVFVRCAWGCEIMLLRFLRSIKCTIIRIYAIMVEQYNTIIEYLVEVLVMEDKVIF